MWLAALSQAKSHPVTCHPFIFCPAGKEMQRNAAGAVQCKRKQGCRQPNPPGARGAVTLLQLWGCTCVTRPQTNPETEENGIE